MRCPASGVHGCWPGSWSHSCLLPSTGERLAGLVRVSGWLEVSWGDAAPRQVQVTFSRLSGACSWADRRSQWEGSGELSGGG